MSTRSSILILGVSALIIGGGIAAQKYLRFSFQSFDIDETAQWQTYRNEEFGIQFEYPKTWLVGRPPGKYKDFLMLAPSEKIQEMESINWEADAVLPISISVSGERFYSCTGDEFTTAISEKKILVDRLEGVQCVEYAKNVPFLPRNITFISTEFERNKKFYTITFHKWEGGENYQEIYDHIISTLQFIEKRPDVFSWQTYHNDTLGFEIQYPVTWNVEGRDDSRITFCDSADIQIPNEGVCSSRGTAPHTNIYLSIIMKGEGDTGLYPFVFGIGKTFSGSVVPFGIEDPRTQCSITQKFIDSRVVKLWDCPSSLHAFWEKSMEDDYFFSMSTYSLDVFPEDAMIFDEMLSTFKFLK